MSPKRALNFSAEIFFDNAPCGYLVTDLSGKIIRANTTISSLVGYNQESLLSMNRFSDLLSISGKIFWRNPRVAADKSFKVLFMKSHLISYVRRWESYFDLRQCLSNERRGSPTKSSLS